MVGSLSYYCVLAATTALQSSVAVVAEKDHQNPSPSSSSSSSGSADKGKVDINGEGDTHKPLQEVVFEAFKGFQDDVKTFAEQFLDPNVLNLPDGPWIKSRGRKSGDGADDFLEYRGLWEVGMFADEKARVRGDYGLMVKTPAAHHGISRRIPKVVLRDAEVFTVQYEVRAEDKWDCGGAYVKLLQDDGDKDLDQASLTDKSPFSIMFGPDRCGATNKVHFIINYKNPSSGKLQEHALKNPPSMPFTKTRTALYRLRIWPKQDKYAIDINGVEKKTGSLKEDLDPPVIPEKEIDDPDETKPLDWVDQAKIPDPEAQKPDDWDESAPEEIEDVNAVMPEGWLVDEPPFIDDPESAKPATGDDSKDGTSKPNPIPNPKCAEAPGCGEWPRPRVPNPAYKGPWSAPLIDNPAYKGLWKPSKIANPDYFTTESIASGIAPFSTLFFELWTVNANLLFDNIVVSVSSDLQLLEDFTKATFGLKSEREKAAETAKLQNPPPAMGEDERVPPGEQFSVQAARSFGQLFLKDPTKAIAHFPILFGSVLMALVALPLIAVSLISARSSRAALSKPTEPQDDVSDGKDGDDVAVTQGAETLRKRRGGKSSSDERDLKSDASGAHEESDETANN